MFRLTAKGFAVSERVFCTALRRVLISVRHSGNVPSAPALLTAAARRGATAPPMGASTIGMSIPSILYSRSRIRSSRHLEKDKDSADLDELQLGADVQVADRADFLIDWNHRSLGQTQHFRAGPVGRLGEADISQPTISVETVENELS